MIIVQPIVDRDTHCTVYSLLWTEMITVQPIVDRDTHCTVSSLLWTEMIGVQPIVERDDHHSDKSQARTPRPAHTVPAQLFTSRYTLC